MKAILVVGVLSVCALAACKRDEGPKPEASAAAPVQAQAAPTVLTPPVVKGGIPECDEMLAQMTRCIDSKRAPEALRESYRTNFEKTSVAYQKVSGGTPSERSSIMQVCKASMEAGKVAFDKYCN
jgi:hypothetical protein